MRYGARDNEIAERLRAARVDKPAAPEPVKRKAKRKKPPPILGRQERAHMRSIAKE